VLIAIGVLTQENPVYCIQISRHRCPQPSVVPDLLIVLGVLIATMGTLWALVRGLRS
jgi:hypothetical protein